MGEQEPEKVKKHICAGLLAHVDAGKTTLSEAMLYLSGNIRRVGRVDNGDAFLDTFALERARGITIFSKQAMLRLDDMQITLLDTPGHVDFSAEMERTLWVLDYAVLVISGADGVQGHTKTLWRLLKRYQIPVFLFINKMDQPGVEKEALLAELKRSLHTDCVDFTEENTDVFYENVAMCEEEALEVYLEEGSLSEAIIARLIQKRGIFPCYFGSALKMDGVLELLNGICTYTLQPDYTLEFGAKVFKIARDLQGNRLTYLKLTGGSLRVKQMLSGKKLDREEKTGGWEEKVNQIRIYSGEKYEAVEEAEPGMVCAVTGLTQTYPGEGVGVEEDAGLPVLEPVLTYRLDLPEGIDAALILPKLKQLEEEEPALHIVWNEALQEIQVQIMGEVQMEVLKSLIQERFGIDISFGTGNIVYKETILDMTQGVGHFEPLRHYAEVHLLLEPLERGSGMQFALDCAEDMLEKNWQRLVLTHLEEREHRGVLTGSVLTDMKITLIAGRAHQKHTEGGDFRQATYRAIRQGLMQAQSLLLEPYYDFWLEIPERMIGRAMTDIERMHGTLYFDENDEVMDDAKSCDGFESSRVDFGGLQCERGMRLLRGRAPVATMQDYQKEVTAYTRGSGRLSCVFGGYQPCCNSDEVIERSGYRPEQDSENPASSVFCAHGAGFIVEWDRVETYMHIERKSDVKRENLESGDVNQALSRVTACEEKGWIGVDEIDRILDRTYNANRRSQSNPSKDGWKKRRYERAVSSNETRISAVTRESQPRQKAEEYLLVDGYNIIFAWEDLKELAAVSMDGARGKLLDRLCNYQGICGCHLIVVFDAYRVKGHQTEIFDYHNIHVVYTKEAETADQYIEKFAHQNAKKYRITVATSDGLEQIIIRGAGCALLSARDLEEEMLRENSRILQVYRERTEKTRNYLFDGVKENMEENRSEESVRTGKEEGVRAIE